MAKAKRIDVPGWGGPVPAISHEEVQVQRVRAIVARNERSSGIRSLSVERLVPEHVRQEYAARWRDEHDELQREEALTRAYRWRAIFRRMIDRLFGAPKIAEPAPPRYDFRG